MPQALTQRSVMVSQGNFEVGNSLRAEQVYCLYMYICVQQSLRGVSSVIQQLESSISEVLVLALLAAAGLHLSLDCGCQPALGHLLSSGRPKTGSPPAYRCVALRYYPASLACIPKLNTRTPLN